MIDVAQIRAARALLNISQTELAAAASVHVATVRRLEGATVLRGNVESLAKIEVALVKLGVEFLPPEPGKGPGVRLRSAT